MGDIVRDVKMCSLTGEGIAGKNCPTVKALIDSGASKTVISTALAKRIGGPMLSRQYAVSIEGRTLPLKLAAVKLQAPKCNADVLAVVVDDQLVARAQRPVDVILGHDYLQNKHVSLRFSLDAQSVACKAELTKIEKRAAMKRKGARRARR